ncbi:MAG: hypothetical protein JXR78_14335 [Victivallales bacterium]|nr:hypothetical protein [Victivallales bacterium]
MISGYLGQACTSPGCADVLFLHFFIYLGQLCSEIKLIAKPPFIDGKENDTCYLGLTENVLVGRSGKEVPDLRKTTFKVAFDREAIYLLIKAGITKPLQNNKSLNSSVDLFSGADILEIFISPISSKNYILVCNVWLF